MFSFHRNVLGANNISKHGQLPTLSHTDFSETLWPTYWSVVERWGCLRFRVLGFAVWAFLLCWCFCFAFCVACDAFGMLVVVWLLSFFACCCAVLLLVFCCAVMSFLCICGGMCWLLCFLLRFFVVLLAVVCDVFFFVCVCLLLCFLLCQGVDSVGAKKDRTTHG